MKKFIKALLIIVIFCFAVMFFKKYCLKDYNIVVKDNNMECKLKYKGLNKAIDFTVDNKGNYYIAYKTKIQYIDKDGKSFDIFVDKNMNIHSIEYYKQKLYFSSNNCIYHYDLHNKECKEIISDLPNFGDYGDSILKINGEYLYVTIGAATNSGVVGDDNKWLKNSPYNHDISPYKIVLRGINFSNGKSGAFVNYGTKNIEGQIIPGHFPGNASIIMYNLDTGSSATYAWGIRNVKGLDFDSRARMIASIGGMEDRGLRPVKGDTDYIFVIKPKSWYGWPDYSGGDPVSSPKFKGKDNKKISFILDNHTTTNPEAPLYINKNLGTLKSIVVDKEGKLGEADSIYFYDDKDKNIWYLNNKGIVNEKLKFSSESKISSVKYIENKIILLDSNKGNLYSYGFKENSGVYANNRPILYFIIIASLMGIVSILKTIMDSKNPDKNN